MHRAIRGVLLLAPLALLTVPASGQAGALRFSSGFYQFDEGVGFADIVIERIGGGAGEISVQYRTSDGSAVVGEDYRGQSGELTWADGDEDPQILPIEIHDDALTEPDEQFFLNLINPTGGATLGSPSTTTVTLVDNDAPPLNPGAIAFSATTYTASEDGPAAVIGVLRFGGSDGRVTVPYSTGDLDAEAGADYTAVSGELVWEDGEGGERTFEVPILDDSEEETAESLQLRLGGPTGGAVAVSSLATLTIIDNDGLQTGPCVADERTLCLNRGERFRARVDWRTGDGASGQGLAVDIGREDSGLFYFFDENNIEMLVKVIDACNLPGFESYWIFYAATTNVEFTLTVTDTVANEQKQYFNPLGTPAPPVQDTRAFQTCP